MRYYIAYGSNLNVDQMSVRCPDAKRIGVSVLKNWRLVFNGVASVVKEKGSEVPVGIWLISDQDEANLDVYEGFPRLYRKARLPINVKYKDGREVSDTAIMYVMNEGRRKRHRPSYYYYQTILQGYEDFGIDPKPLRKALKESC